MRIQKTRLASLATVLACVAVTACESEVELTTQMITATNVPDLFTWSVSDLENVTGGIQYLWTVTGTQVVVDVTEAISSGSAIIQIRDGSGVVVYEHDASDAVDDTTDVPSTGGMSGASGSAFWQVAVVVSKLNGGFSFSAIRLDTLTTP